MAAARVSVTSSVKLMANLPAAGVFCKGPLQNLRNENEVFVLNLSEITSVFLSVWLCSHLFNKMFLIFNLIAIFTVIGHSFHGRFKPKEAYYYYSLKKGILKKLENWRYRENKPSPDFEDNKEKKKKKTIDGKLKQLNKLGFAVNNFIHVWGHGKLTKEVMFICTEEKCLVVEANDPGKCIGHMKVNLYWNLKIFMLYVKTASRKCSVLK